MREIKKQICCTNCGTIRACFNHNGLWTYCRECEEFNNCPYRFKKNRIEIGLGLCRKCNSKRINKK